MRAIEGATYHCHGLGRAFERQRSSSMVWKRLALSTVMGAHDDLGERGGIAG